MLQSSGSGQDLETLVKTVQISCEGATEVHLDELIELQGDFKILSAESYERLKKEIVTTGYAFPIKVWDQDGKKFIVGGHQTKRVLMGLRDEGWVIPLLPVSLVHADNIQQAKQRVLQDASTYGTVRDEGLYQLAHEAGIGPLEVAERFPISNIDMPTFIDSYTEPIGDQSELKGGPRHDKACPQCGFVLNQP